MTRKLTPGPMVLATHVDTPYKTFADVVAAVKAGKNVNYGTIGNGISNCICFTYIPPKFICSTFFNIH